MLNVDKKDWIRVSLINRRGWEDQVIMYNSPLQNGSSVISKSDIHLWHPFYSHLYSLSEMLIEAIGAHRINWWTTAVARHICPSLPIKSKHTGARHLLCAEPLFNNLRYCPCSHSIREETERLPRGPTHKPGTRWVSPAFSPHPPWTLATLGSCFLMGAGGPRGAIPHWRSGRAAVRRYPSSKVRSNGCALLEQPWRDTPRPR